MRSARVMVAAAVALSTLAISSQASADAGDPAAGWGASGVDNKEGLGHGARVDTLADGSVVMAFDDSDSEGDTDLVHVQRYAATGGRTWSLTIPTDGDHVDLVDLDTRGNTAYVTVNQVSDEGSTIEVRKYRPAGLDGTWAEDGVMSFGAGSSRPGASATAAAPGGGLFIAAGRTLYKIDADGDPDLTFSGDGQAPLPLEKRYVSDIAVDSVGRIAIVGGRVAAPARGVLIRLKPNGRLLRSFGSSGVRILSNPKSINTSLSSVSWTSDGKLVVGGRRYGTGVATSERLTSARVSASSGVLDATYGGNGWASHRFGTARFTGGASDVQANGKVLLAGGTGRMWVIVRFRVNGTLDAGFGDKGVLTMNVGEDAPAGVSDVAVDNVHKHLAVAGSETSNQGDTWVAVGAFTLT